MIIFYTENKFIWFRGHLKIWMVLLLSFSFILFHTYECASAPLSGDMKALSITDAKKNNSPPVSTFKASIASKTPTVINFDASSSMDPDGTIISYHWDFGNGKTAEGKIVSYSYSNDGEMQITLKVVDNGGAVSLSRQKYEYLEIVDNFDIDSSQNYTAFSGGVNVVNGMMHGQTWKLSDAYHKIALTAPNHWVQASLTYNGLSDYGGLIARVDPANKTGYSVYFAAGKIHIGRFAGTQNTWLATFDGKYTAGTYTVKLAVDGSTIKVYVNGTPVLSKIDNTYPAGTYVGARINRGSSNADVTIDNLTAVSAQQ